MINKRKDQIEEEVEKEINRRRNEDEDSGLFESERIDEGILHRIDKMQAPHQWPDPPDEREESNEQ